MSDVEALSTGDLVALLTRLAAELARRLEHSVDLPPPPGVRRPRRVDGDGNYPSTVTRPRL